MFKVEVMTSRDRNLKLRSAKVLALKGLRRFCLNVRKISSKCSVSYKTIYFVIMFLFDVHAYSERRKTEKEKGETRETS